MRPLLRSLTRIVAALAVALLVLWGAVFALLRQPTMGRIEAGDLPRADPAILRRHVEVLAGELDPRDIDHPSHLDRAAAYIRRHFETASAAVEDQPFEARGATYRNVLAHLGPPSKELIVVGAHYDSCGVAGANPGADDNASGVAALLELARLLALHPPASEVLLVAFSTEEPPFFASPGMGSAVHARSLRRQGRVLRAMIDLEMIGYFTDEQPWPGLLYRLLYPHTGDFVGVVGRLTDRRLARSLKRSFRGATDVPLYSLTVPEAWVGSTSVDASDHRSYWAEGYPAVMITDTAFLRNPNYHAAGDTPATLDYDRMAGVVDGVLAGVSSLAAREAGAGR